MKGLSQEKLNIFLAKLRFDKYMISIIMPIRNEEKYIYSTIKSILGQKFFNKDYEIIIADGMSTDRTREIINDLIRKNNKIKLIDNPKKIVPVGFNLALNKAKGDIIIRVDGHTKINSDYIFNCVQKLEQNNYANVGGLMNAQGDKLIDHSISIATSSVFGVGNSYFHFSSKSRYVDTVFMGAWKKEIFYKYGGFDEELVRNQDDEFNFRISQQGEKIWLDTSIKSEYFPRNTLKKLFKQYFQYGFYKIRLFQKRGGFSSYRHLIPGLFVSSLIASILLFFIYDHSYLLLLVGGSYFLVNLFFSLYSAFISHHEDKKYLTKFFKLSLLLPIIYFILHLSYGLGSLIGIIYFFNKLNDTEVCDTHFKKDKDSK